MLLTFISVVNFITRPLSSRKQLLKHIRFVLQALKATLYRLVTLGKIVSEQGIISMSLYTVEQVHIFVEKRP